ncbi:hypothetical protein T01_12083 [Trichinella spiralis]|uniref:Uncharacterized protein n=1 Tax=Trichinella spiralis TaxID=6334 RepID=A0A0V0YZC0_TRISP|nr:hypothetical protein T01_12083 [Trichinella spiralis]
MLSEQKIIKGASKRTSSSWHFSMAFLDGSHLTSLPLQGTHFDFSWHDALSRTSPKMGSMLV